MRILLSSGTHTIRLALPTSLLLSRPAVWLWLKSVRLASRLSMDYIPEEVQEITVSVPNTLPEDTVYALCAELRRIKKTHGSWELVNVQSSNGDSVQIIL